MLEQFANEATEELTRRLLAVGFSVQAFPARRANEEGWCIGHSLGGATMTHQVHTEWEPTDALAREDNLSAFVAKLVDLAPTTSALMRRAHDRPNVWTEACGLYLRWVQVGENIRVDTLVGKPYPKTEAA